MSHSFRRICTAVVATLLVATSGWGQNDAASRRAAIDGMYPIMMGALEAKNFGRARNICDQAIMWEPQNPVHHYNLACIEAQAGGTRLPYAWGALELSIALGFDDAEHMKTDPDLLPLHSDPKFADLLRKIAFSVTAGTAIASINVPATGALNAPSSNPASVEQPIAPSFHNNLPLGLYYMTRYLPATQTVEKSVWYFAPGGEVFAGLEDGFSRTELDAHRGPRGKISAGEGGFEIGWTDGRRTKSKLERDGDGFTWDMGIFSPVTAFENPDDAAGVYECVESLPPGSSAVPQRLELRADGTFSWEGVSISGSDARTTTLKSGYSHTTSGRWELSGYSLRLTTSNGIALRRFVFPSDDEKTVIKPDRMFFAGLMFKRRP